MSQDNLSKKTNVDKGNDTFNKKILRTLPSLLDSPWLREIKVDPDKTIFLSPPQTLSEWPIDLRGFATGKNAKM